MKKQIVVAGLIALVSLACAATAVAGSKASKVAKGHTSQGRQILVAIHGNAVQLRHFTIKLRCRKGGVLIDNESGFLPSMVHGHGRVHDHQVGSTDDVYVRGHLNKRWLHGAIRVRDKWGKNNPCDSHWVRFSARR